jgi:hypothetical protein
MIKEGQRKQRSKKWRTRISKGLKRYYSEHKVWNKGIEHSEVTKHKISISCKRNGIGTWNRGRSKKKSTKEEVVDQE